MNDLDNPNDTLLPIDPLGNGGQHYLVEALGGCDVSTRPERQNAVKAAVAFDREVCKYLGCRQRQDSPEAQPSPQRDVRTISAEIAHRTLCR